MNILIQNWIDAGNKVYKARQEEIKAEKLAQTAPLPEAMRPAEPKDIVENAIIWYPEHREDDDEYPCAGWHQVSEVHRPSDDFKAYTDHTGCRYGLEGAFVEI